MPGPESRPLAVIAVLAALVLTAGCGDDGDDSGEPAATTEASGGGAAATEGQGPTGEEEAADRPGTQLYFTAGEQFEAVERRSLDDAEEAARALLEGPLPGDSEGAVETTTQIPDGVELDGVTVADGTATVEVSPEFLAGVPEDPAARNREQEAEAGARVAQVAYTMSQFEGVKQTKVVSGGVPVEVDTAGEATGGVSAPAEAQAKVARADYAAPEQGPAPVAKPRGAKVPGTRQVQTRLAKLGYLPKRAIDGVAGYQTQQAVLAFQAWNGLARDGVVGPMTTAALKSARRPKPRAGGPAHRIEVYRDRGVALLVEAGRTKRAIHVSSGGPGTETPSGSYAVFRKELRSWSVPFQTWLPYASYFNQGIAFHEYPDVPPYPASHGCVRVPAPEAKGVYAFATIGTKVLVY
jgi:lipoprotein-anchoring transpeptidase ErfK/SrfK